MQTSSSRSERQRGFSLVETVAALGILSLAAIPLMQLATNAVQNTGRLEVRLLARTTAENALTRAVSSREPIELGLFEGSEIQMGRPFEWDLTVYPTDRPTLFRFEVNVREEGRDQILARLMTLKGVPAPSTASDTASEAEGVE
ncbi:type II secretion system protein GspI [Henriciella barbarensis]|uniref:Type II secretion system protein I n=1 Tax=Henriciella barbarensis TaxID=86342 RepID=A0A399QSB7_9PROT|nr:type II secretion system minor pseudopilin GspI [Henriciella barbarensis]RIJ20562.1 type II secretion system protein GspI [Henriciella barbarensis]